MTARVAPIAALAAILVIAPAAVAHVTVNPPEWEAGGFARFAVRVPNERDNADTTRVTVKFPEQVLSARFQPIEGWRRTVKLARLDQPIEEEGERITERIDTVTWSDGRLRPGEFQEFGVSFQVPEVEPGTELAFPSVQRYSNGDVVRWIGPPDAEEPAPTVTVLQSAADDEEEGAAARPAPTPAEGAGGAQEEADGSDTLSIAALIAGVAGLTAGLAAIFWRGRPVRAVR